MLFCWIMWVDLLVQIHFQTQFQNKSEQQFQHIENYKTVQFALVPKKTKQKLSAQWGSNAGTD